MAHDLGVSRNTVMAAFDQLFAEGYIDSYVGCGSFVSKELPEMTPAGQSSSARSGKRIRGMSKRGHALSALHATPKERKPAFSPGLPDTDNFPFKAWTRLMSRTWRHPDAALLSAGDPAGYLPLRRAIADYLATARAVDCSAEEVIVVSGAQQAISLAAHVLLDEGDPALIEEPGYPGISGALMGAGAALQPVPVDDEGFDVGAAEKLAPEAYLACVAPSRQYPLGITMTLSRRLELLDWAVRVDGWIIEDDYDSEYRYTGKPLASLQGLDRDRRVVYLGSFSKVLFPSLRLGYLVVPPDLVDDFRKARRALDDHPSILAQPVLASFIENGLFSAHLRRMRKLYHCRQRALLSAAKRHLSGLLRIEAADAGMHLMAYFSASLARRMNDVEASRRAAAVGVSVYPLSTFYANPQQSRQGLLLGYAAVPEAEMDAAVGRLAIALGGAIDAA
jgi:GntR family transcriptional regulator/MocR family aminotransferase